MKTRKYNNTKTEKNTENRGQKKNLHCKKMHRKKC